MGTLASIAAGPYRCRAYLAHEKAQQWRPRSYQIVSPAATEHTRYVAGPAATTVLCHKPSSRPGQLHCDRRTNPIPVRTTATTRLAAPKYRSHRKAGRKARPKKPPAIPTARSEERRVGK